ncbi:sugar phosphate isomerase/epimerase family protein [Nocardioides bizhenqiangii]|uniref:Sugar phosphate isomerase/epimerase family protein n=1 Tax=Nocardioides bizhenqiangii TaxID=3095076 RepID=A0ABZ0ZSG9_9ACTN|nr:sugar phosphate isomerase/epimerase family protein [Nocardioides sp. HM61]WQQ27215.1 sugar phosphate isomerase/epimerase family protein [Nocardioides sp. HM61]
MSTPQDTTALDVPSRAPARMDTPAPGDPRLARLSLNQKTVDGWSLRTAVEACAAHGIPAIGVWREPLAVAGVDAAAAMIRDAGLRVSSLCRGGFFTAADGAERRSRHDDNLRALDEAAALGAPCLVLVPGGLPAGDRDLRGARARAAQAVADLVPHALEVGVRLAIEPMHPIFAADRGVVSTLAQALDIAEPLPTEAVGVVVDTFHVWWEPGIEDQIARAAGRIASYQVCEWITPLPPDALLSRGMMGDGHIDFAHLSRCVAAAGYRGDVEVEIFNAEVWEADGHAVLDTLARRYVELVEPHV